MISKEDVQKNTFVQGIITEASPLSFPPNASLDEVNFKLNRDGSRYRRLGLDFEEGYMLTTTGYTADQIASSTRSFYRWPNPGTENSIEIGVVQIGSFLYFINLLTESPSSNILNGGVPINAGLPLDAKLEYSLIGNQLIVVSADMGQPFLLTYNETTDVISYVTAPIKVRDTVGVQDNLTVDQRPTTLSNLHRYNLLNQGWLETGIESTCGTGISPTQCTFNTFGVYPSNADQWSIGRVEDVQSADVKKYDPNIAKRYLINAGQVPKGHYIIDAFDRGASRQAASGVTGLPLDREQSRLSCVASYAGRAWYAGIRSNISGGDDRSSIFNGLLLYSQVMQSPIDLVKCYQEADPTSPDLSDLVDTDGGAIRIPEISFIVKLMVVQASLFVFAENGIWEIRGDDAGFRATGYQVNKISGLGVSSPRSIVEVNGTLFFWAYDGIYALVRNDMGLYEAQSITIPTIQKLYNSLPENARRTAKGYYDAANNKLRWLYYSEEAAYTGTPGTIIGGGGVVPTPFDLQALLDAGVANILAGVGSDYRLNVDVDNAFVAFQHKDAVYNGSAGAGGIRPAIGLSAAGIAMGYNDAGGTWHNAVAIDATGDASFAGTVAANSILTNSIQLGASIYTVDDVITLLGSSPTTFDLQGALDAGVGYIKAGLGGDYEMIVDDSLAYAAFKHKDAVFEGIASAGAGHTALGISANGIAMGFNDPVTGAWTNAVSITSSGDATFLGTIAADSVIANNVAVVGKSTTLGQMADDIATFVGGSFNLQAALDIGVTNILAGTGADYRLTVDTNNAFVAIHHKDALYDGIAVSGSGIRPAIGLSANGIGMGYNDVGGNWVNSVAIDSSGNATFAGTIAANSVIANSVTVDGVTLGTTTTNGALIGSHIASTGNVHNVDLAQITGDLDDIANGATYFKTTDDQVTGADRAFTALDSSADYIRSIQSTKITVSGTNPTTGWVGDASGIRLYQGGSLRVNIPVSGSPSFSGDISGGSNINITGQGIFSGAATNGGYSAAVHANPSFGATYGVVGRTNASGGAGTVGVNSTSGGAGVRAISTVSGGNALEAINNGGGIALVTSGTSSFNGNVTITGTTAHNGAITTTSTALVSNLYAQDAQNLRGQISNVLKFQRGTVTGTGVATFVGSNKPGGNSSNAWVQITIDSSTYYFPVWA